MATVLATPAAALADDTIEVTDLSVSGGVGKNVVARAVDDALKVAGKCFDEAVAKQAKVDGTVTLKFRIDTKGTPTNVTATGVASVNSCVITGLKAVVFPAPTKPVDVTEKLALHTQRTAGILGSTALQQGGAFASLTGTGDIGTVDDDSIYGGLLGNEAGEMNGGFGYGKSGFGPGGGGTGWGTIGTGRYGSVADGDPSTTGDKQVIRDAVQRQLGKIQGCYAKELAADPKLAGTVTVKFHIEATGKVSSTSGSGLAKVDDCIAKVIGAIIFPNTSGGAIDVSYPFVLTAAGGTGSGYGVGGGRGGMRGKSAVPTVSIGQPNVQGDLDKAIIRRYIKRNIQKIQYCYEKQLLANATLNGTVQTQFTIGDDGKVTESTGAGVHPDVSSCVADVIKQIEFPKPKSSGGVKVNYPFTFRPAGS